MVIKKEKKHKQDLGFRFGELGTVSLLLEMLLYCMPGHKSGTDARVCVCVCVCVEFVAARQKSHYWTILQMPALHSLTVSVKIINHSGQSCEGCWMYVKRSAFHLGRIFSSDWRESQVVLLLLIFLGLRGSWLVEVQLLKSLSHLRHTVTDCHWTVPLGQVWMVVESPGTRWRNSNATDSTHVVYSPFSDSVYCF